MSGKEAATGAPAAAAEDSEFCAGVMEIKAKNFAAVGLALLALLSTFAVLSFSR